MIHNIIFDIGNVLLHYAPDEFTRHYVKNEALAEEIRRQIFDSPEWPMLDRGVLTRKQALERILARGQADAELVSQVYYGWPELIRPIDGTVELLGELKAAGYGLYYLSNYAHETFKDAFERFKFFRLFDGGTVSYELLINKPEPGIYKALLEKYALDPAGCLFIDDMPDNVRGALDVGMNALRFEGDEKLREALAECGVKPREAVGLGLK